MKLAAKPEPIRRVMGREEGKPPRRAIVGLRSVTDKVAKKTRYAKRDVGDVIRAALEQIAAEIARGNTVRLPGIGTFSLSERSERMANAFGNGLVLVPAHKTVRFKAARPLKNSLK